MSVDAQQEHRKRGLCFYCHKHGHLARDCPDKKKTPFQTRQVTTTPETPSSPPAPVDRIAQLEEELKKLRAESPPQNTDF